MPSLFPRPVCVGEDIDNDGKPNHQDLDSDGDGAFDVLEVGFADDDKDGVLGVSPVTVDRFGAVTSATGYTFTKDYYKTPTLNAGKDTDNDGIIDVFDVDDDNDGIYDHVESPDCFNLVKTIYERGDRRELLTISTTLPYTTGSTNLLIDGLTTAASGVVISAVPVLNGLEIIRVSTPYAIGLEYSSITLSFSATGFFTNASRVIIQGSQDGVNWTDLSESVAPGVGSVVTIAVTKNQGLYGVYRLLGDSGIATSKILTEVTGTIEAYMPSLYPKTQCIGEDIDNDGIPNHQDLDADGDGDNDVIEAGFIDGDQDGKLGTSPITVNALGEVTSGIGYMTPYNYYKTAAIVITKDTDGDGVWDVFDVDDDNDGIYDHVESPDCFNLSKFSYQRGDRRELLTISTALPYSIGSPNLWIDGLTTVASGVTISAVPVLKGKEIIKVSTPYAIGLEYSSISLNFSATGFFTTASRVIVQGSKDDVNWTDLSESVAPGVGPVVTISITKNQGLYRMYRLLGDSGTATSRILTEFTGTIGAYMPSLYPKSICEGVDADQDGIPNHHDLNADGDSCDDVIEAGFLDPDRDGKLGNSPVTVDHFGKVTSALGYITPNNLYFLDRSKNVCTGEGIPLDEDSHCIDLDNITNDYMLAQSTFHSSIVRTKTGFSAFGEYTKPGGVHLRTPVEMIPVNGYTYDGTIIAATLGGFGYKEASNQFFILSTEGLYTWASTAGLGTVIPTSWASTIAFQKIGMPEGVMPRDVKVISGSYTNLMILTKSGDVYVASGNNALAYGAHGDGSTSNDAFWHKSAISHVTSIKINSYGQAMALTISGDIYTWGLNVLLGDGTAARNLLLPTKMTLPTTITSIKMTALSYGTSVVYYVLGDDKRVYALGSNTNGLLGIGTTTVSELSWQTVKAPAGGTGYLENIKFINASIHDSFDGSAGAIDANGTPYLWGNNDSGKLGTTGSIILPVIPNKSTAGDYDVIYLELGGHVTPLVDIKLGKFGYVGHKVNGSMGDGSVGDSWVNVYDFDKTPEIDFCNIVIGTKRTSRVMVNPMNINTKPDRKE